MCALKHVGPSGNAFIEATRLFSPADTDAVLGTEPAVITHNNRGVIRFNSERRERAVESARTAVGQNRFRADFLIEPMHSGPGSVVFGLYIRGAPGHPSLF